MRMESGTSFIVSKLFDGDTREEAPALPHTV